jgi:N-acetylglucosaminyldiphosphoundecaprenol N-acetyl-beta-D-mannosaminyltransferase
MGDRKSIHQALKRIRKHTLFFLNVRVDNIDVETALETVHAFTSVPDEIPPREVFFTNVHTIHLARKHPEFRQCVNGAEMVLPDGSGLKIAGRAFGEPIRENLNGTDFAPKIFRYAELSGSTIYLLGARQEVIDGCRAHLRTRYPNLKIVGCHPGYFSREEERHIIEDINEKEPDILLVALGSPHQEVWITRHRHHLKVRVCFAVGGLFDFIGGAVRRAPHWMRAVGCEWLFRFFQDPRSKWARVFVEIPSFLILMLANRFLSRDANPFVSRELALKR